MPIAARTTACILAPALACALACAATACSGSSGNGAASDAGSSDAFSADGAPPDGSLDAGTSDGAPACQVLTSVAGDASGVVACTDSGAGTGDGGAIGCGFSACLSGGLPYDFGPQAGCGGVGLDTIYWFDQNPTITQTSFNLHLSSNMPIDQVGPLPVASVEITKGLGADGGMAAWKTPPGACTATIASSTCAPTTVFPRRRILTGTGSCTQPAAPESGTSGTPVGIGDFVFEGFVNPP
jgi:hypothetical protein